MITYNIIDDSLNLRKRWALDCLDPDYVTETARADANHIINVLLSTCATDNFVENDVDRHRNSIYNIQKNEWR